MCILEQAFEDFWARVFYPSIIIPTKTEEVIKQIDILKHNVRKAFFSGIIILADAHASITEEMHDDEVDMILAPLYEEITDFIQQNTQIKH